MTLLTKIVVNSFISYAEMPLKSIGIAALKYNVLYRKLVN